MPVYCGRYQYIYILLASQFVLTGVPAAMTVESAKYELLVEEELECREGRANFSLQAGSLTAFILLGLEIEELQ